MHYPSHHCQVQQHHNLHQIVDVYQAGGEVPTRERTSQRRCTYNHDIGKHYKLHLKNL